MLEKPSKMQKKVDWLILKDAVILRACTEKEKWPPYSAFRYFIVGRKITRHKSYC